MTNMARAGGNTRTSARDLSAQISVRDVHDTLVRVLGRQLLGVIVKKSSLAIQGWDADESVPSAEDEQRLRNAYKVYVLLSTEEGDDTIRA